MKPRLITDPVEQIVANVLTRHDISFIHESENAEQRQDFILTGSNVAIEVKQFFTPRVTKQLEANPDVILIQGRKAAIAFAELLNNRKLDLDGTATSK